MELKDKKILFLGDSITAGGGATAISESYWKQLERNTGAVCIGYGIGGTRIAKQLNVDDFEKSGNFCTRADSMEEDADIIVVFGGTNDYGHGDAPFGKLDDDTVDTFCGAVNVLIKKLINKYPDSTIVFMTPTHRIDETGRIFNERNVRIDFDLEDYADAISEICKNYSIPVLDLFRLSGMQPNIAIIKEHFMPDGLHPNNCGHARIAQRLEGFLKSL